MRVGANGDGFARRVAHETAEQAVVTGDPLVERAARQATRGVQAHAHALRTAPVTHRRQVLACGGTVDLILRKRAGAGALRSPFGGRAWDGCAATAIDDRAPVDAAIGCTARATAASRRAASPSGGRRAASPSGGRRAATATCATCACARRCTATSNATAAGTARRTAAASYDLFAAGTTSASVIRFVGATGEGAEHDDHGNPSGYPNHALLPVTGATYNLALEPTRTLQNLLPKPPRTVFRTTALLLCICAGGWTATRHLALHKPQFAGARPRSRAVEDFLAGRKPL